MKIPAGRATLKFNWYISAAGGLQQLANPTTNLTLDVPPATSERMSALRKKVEEILDKGGRTSETLVPEYMLIRTEHRKEFLPVCFRILRSERLRENFVRYPLLSYVYDCSRESKEVQQQLIDFLQKNGTRDDIDIFGFWERGKVGLKQEEIAKLLSSPNLWIKALAYSNFRDLCPPGTKEALLEEIDRDASQFDAPHLVKIIKDRPGAPTSTTK